MKRPCRNGALLAALLLGASAAQAQLRSSEPIIPRSTLPGIGPLDRRVVVDARAAPWNALGRVQTEVGGRCTGVLIAPDRVLTAAHCLLGRATARLVQPGSVHFLQGYRLGEHNGHARVASFVIGPGWNAASRAPLGADWAILTLATPIAGPTIPLWQAGVPAGSRLMLGGYQQDRPEVLLADIDCGALGLMQDAAGLPMLAHDCTATRGASGAPVLLALPEGRFAVAGVVSAQKIGAGRGYAVPAEALR